MSAYQQQQPQQQHFVQPINPPPNLPIHYEHMFPSPTPTVRAVNEDPYSTDKYGEKRERNSIPQLGATHDNDSEPINKKNRRMDNRHGCIRCLCCACCLPAWATGILWFIIIAVIIVVIVIGAIAGTFVMPTMDMAGVISSPSNGSQITITGDGININFGLLINVNNPNLLSIDLSDINATAYYPNPNGNGHTQIGGGFLAYQNVPKYSNQNFTFPFALEYNPSYDVDQSVLNDLAEKCGLTGGSKSDITIDYTIRLTAKVLVIKVHPTISSSATFSCPLDSGAMSGLTDGTITDIVNSKRR